MADHTKGPKDEKEKVGGMSAKGEILRAYMSKFVRRLLLAVGLSPDRIHQIMANMTDGQRELFQMGLNVAPGLVAFIVAKLPLSVFSGFKNPQEAAETVTRFLDEIIESIEEAAETYHGLENVPPEVLEKAADDVIAKVPRMAPRAKLRSPIEVLGALFEKDDAKRKEWNDWFRSLSADDRARLKEFMPYLDSIEELEGLLKIDAADRMAHLDFLINQNQGFQAAKAAREFSAKVGGFMRATHQQLKNLDQEVLRPMADELSHDLEKRSSVATFGWALLLLSPFAALATWLLSEDRGLTGWVLFGAAGAGLVSVIVGALLRKKRATTSGLSNGWNFLRVPFLALGTAVRWATDEIGAVKRLILVALTLPFLLVLGASLLNRPYLVFYTSLVSVVFSVAVLVIILVDTTLAFMAAGVIGAVTKKEGLFPATAVAAVRDWASSTVAWYSVIFLTFMYVPWASPMAVAIIAASTLFFGAQRLAHWFHSTMGRRFAYGGAILLAAIVLTREVSPMADAYAGRFARTHLGGDFGLKGIEDRVLLRNLDDERQAIRERAIAECGQEFCSPEDTARDADIVQRRDDLVKGVYWDTRNGTRMVLSKEETDSILGDLEAAEAE